MTKLIDRVLLGGAFVCSGLIHRKVGHVERVQDDVAARPPVREETSGMPLPTGYGIQVTGPNGEDIVIPVCLPPGFELASLVIAPSFLPEGEPARTEPELPAMAASAAPAASADAPAPAPAERLDRGMRLVYGESPSYSAHLEQDVPSAATERVPQAPPLRESVL